MSTLTPQDFVAKWRQVTVKERSGYQEHFRDLCRLIGHPSPTDDDPTGERYAFEAGASKTRDIDLRLLSASQSRSTSILFSLTRMTQCGF